MSSSVFEKLLPCSLFVSAIRFTTLRRGSLADRLLRHYCQGAGSDFSLSTALLLSDKSIASFLRDTLISSRAGGLMSGRISICQSKYSEQSLCYALGGITVDWHCHQGSSFEISFRKKYAFSPKEKRVSQAFHKAAVQLSVKADSCSEFCIKGRPAFVTFGGDSLKTQIGFDAMAPKAQVNTLRLV